MKEHFCPAEQSTITYQGKCNWCGEQEALAQTQEPVAWMYVCNGDEENPVLVNTQKDWAKSSWWHEIPLYTTPSQRTEQLKACVYCGQLVAKEKNNGV